ncbi:bifunctional pyr operon transcriptional regulator/uracil phosphoribosyltransferase PyrR [Persicirhabdus sediminis]|uniref:Bifunctional protein PyrR n=1 Tax=Persicirhabdus sediminis TaxID=454144 RepID=A0A8J7MEV8_9BACT|nr:bifunctional pyr operon transcriptional regulator/uracil phosphoribosyltransferase PyrR [Persicirhabdus sediminis]MBK1791393.1 bifunctional pyr operon transcriptional regulator/uracil phosphoribosyltransferase PyrR [Persicirhabdus sediminis]
MNMGEDKMAEAVEQLAGAIVEKYAGEKFALIGLRSRGDEVALRLKSQLEAKGVELDFGILDISLYRDDLNHLSANPKLQASEISFAVDGAKVILVDDVLFTGRTVRSAIDALMDYGRPAGVELAVLVDRGHRELPIEPNYVGISIETERLDDVVVHLKNTDGVDEILVHRAQS